MATTLQSRRKASPPTEPTEPTKVLPAEPPAARKPVAKKAAPKTTPVAKKAVAKKAVAKKAAGTKVGAKSITSPEAPARQAPAKRRTPGQPKPATAQPVVAASPATVLQAAEPNIADAVMAVLAPVPAAAPTGPAHSAIRLLPGDQHRAVWQPGHACPPAVLAAAALHVDSQQRIAPDDDAALPLLLRLAQEAGHTLQVDEAVWPHLAAHRDARTRLALLEAAYPAGPASPALTQLLRSALPTYQAEGALFAVVAGRALIADERGLGKTVQAIAAATLWQRHFGLRRIAVLCAPAQRWAWQRAWQRFAPDAASPAPQVMDGGLHQRQVLWSSAAAVRILAPEALASDAAHLAHWAPELIIVDEPQQLGLRSEVWAQLAAPHALVLCGAALADQPALMAAIVDWLDDQRLGPKAALAELQNAAEQGLPLDEADIERLTASLSRLMLQRQRSDVWDQLPALVHSERLLVLAPGQREAHDTALAQARRLLAGWQGSGYLSDADQWRLASALRSMQQACHRAHPDNPHSALAEATVQALAGQLSDWADGAERADGAAADSAGTRPLQVALLCASAADRDQLAQRLGSPDGLHLLLADDPWPAGLDAVLQAGVPWRPQRSPAGPRGQCPAGQQWLYLVAQDSLDAGLFNTLAARQDVPRGVADSAARGYLQGARLDDWLRAVQAALQALPPAPAAAPL